MRAHSRALSEADFGPGMQEVDELLREAEGIVNTSIREELVDGELRAGGQGESCDTIPIVVMCLKGLGFGTAQAQQAAKYLMENSPYCLVRHLQPKMERIKRLFPGVDLNTLVGRHPEVIDLDLSQTVDRLIFLSSTLGGDIDVMDVVSREGRLLLCPDMQHQVTAAISKLASLLPDTYPRGLLLAYLREEPTILIRMAWHTEASVLTQLPVDMQNLFVEGGGGGGAGWKDWDGFSDNHTD